VLRAWLFSLPRISTQQSPWHQTVGHGDLKTTNLWVEPEKPYFCGLKKLPRRLIALDCVDFNPEFCHIDTLSDVAMLTIDLEMYISNRLKIHANWQEVEEAELAQHFLEYYQRVIQENSEKWKPLLEYYMTEKSMVCAYVSILYDERPVAGERYLEVTLNHAQRLQKLLESAESELSNTSKQTAIAAR
jgi:aminoglycoside phosphotransferase family enzyme